MGVARKLFPRIALLYGAIGAAASPTTEPKLVELVRQHGQCEVEARGGEIGVSRRHALALASQSDAPVHYCDFDRLLHWMRVAPTELGHVLAQAARAEHTYTILGRTPVAFATHPEHQQRTEELTNVVASRWLGRTVDVTAGSCAMTAATARLILNHSKAPTNATDAEWPAIVARAGGTIGYVETDGLSFETADFHAPEIAAAGSLEVWLERLASQPDAWAVRTRLALESIEAIAAVARGEK